MIPPARAEVPAVLVLGDSLTAGFGLPHEDGFQARMKAALAARGRPIRFIDGAVSGDTTAGGLARLDWVLADKPDAAIVELGANDGLRGLDPRQMEANLTKILDTLASRKIPVLLCGMYAIPNFGPQYADDFRMVFIRLSLRPGVIFDPFFLQDVATITGLNQPDGLHPNAAGVNKIVARLLPSVEKLLDRVRTE